jgi:membrane protein DedA with SNARE-associated domain
MSSFIQHYGYWALFFLAVIESALAPIPSEVTFGFAGAYCTTAVAGASHFSLIWVIVLGTVGSLVGSIIAYEVGRVFGRAIVDRWGKWILLTHADLDTAEAWFAKFGDVSVLIGRVIPVVRSAISVPAGLAEMSRKHFLWMTVLGSAAWVSLLSALGYSAGTNWQHMSHIFHKAQTPTIIVLVLLVGWFFWHRIRTVRAHHGTRAR